MEAKGMEAKDLAGTVNEASPDIIYCGYVYTGYNLQGFSNGLVPWRNTKAYVKSYNISGACLCTFRIGEPGRESTPVVLKGPIQGNLDDKAFNVLCEQGGGPPPSIKRGDTGDLAVAASASVEPFNCGYVSAEQGQRGDSVRLPLGAYSWIPGKTLQSYRITGNCHCAFRRNVPIPGVADVTGPLTGDLKVAYETAICERSFSSKRDEPQDLAATIASAPVLAKEDAVQCGYAYSEHSLRGKQVSLPGDGSKVYYEIINSYVISGECLCTFASKPGAVPENVHDIKGPGQGEIYIDAASVVCRMV
ncbi:hypothetical protein P171DRAFT_427523 [Karstenula rhodostoma CBS 690.94]|uniref:Uncharacterized protein n=1 Tax=Karstenula rhodostoma CBS 690.94 TaxID=1392251 RepID=A0A9P4UG87_9PLEO|nr:hypothetical protein P171DRAFT_427523 [Karstenula rhodostoma CBS 690.94]